MGQAEPGRGVSYPKALMGQKHRTKGSVLIDLIQRLGGKKNIPEKRKVGRIREEDTTVTGGKGAGACCSSSPGKRVECRAVGLSPCAEIDGELQGTFTCPNCPTHVKEVYLREKRKCWGRSVCESGQRH